MRIVQPEELRNQQRKYCGCPMQSFKQSIDFRGPNGAHKNTEGLTPFISSLMNQWKTNQRILVITYY